MHWCGFFVIVKKMTVKTYDIIIMGAGAAGIFAAGRIKNKSVCILDSGEMPLRRVAVSGGGKCNFTNMAADHNHYFGENNHFARSALSRWTPADMLEWANAHNINIYEKSTGQYFADDSANIINALIHDAHDADIISNTTVKYVTHVGDIFKIDTNNGNYAAKNLVIATGGISYPNISTGDIGYKIAKSFGHKIIPPRPALCGIKTKVFDSNLSGISLPVEIEINHEIITDNMLFTHWGLGGPAIYRTTVRDLNDGFIINLLPNCKNTFEWLKSQKTASGKKQLKTILSSKLPERVAEFLAGDTTKNIADWRDTELQEITNKISNIKITQKDFTLQKFDAAEVTRGGIDTASVSSKTMESKIQSGLYFIGECLDITGDLGGYNLHWAWASANALAENFK